VTITILILLYDMLQEINHLPKNRPFLHRLKNQQKIQFTLSIIWQWI